MAEKSEWIKVVDQGTTAMVVPGGFIIRKFGYHEYSLCLVPCANDEANYWIINNKIP